MPGNLAARGRPFEPKERKTKRIASILNDYLEGPVILRELIQNAEDAGATEVFFVLDARSQPKETLISPGLRKFSGPALLAGNNAVFNEDDYKSLSNIGDSVKREDITKTGKFGVGFLSVYHWTDSPCFISGTNFVILEPHGRPDTLDAREGMRFDFADLPNDFNDQLAPFKAFYKDFTQPYNGTLFRLPLRTTAHAAESEIKSHPTHPQHILADIFPALFHDSVDCLLFQRNVETIRFFKHDDGMSTPTLLYETRISNMNTVQAERRRLVDYVKTLANGPGLGFTTSIPYEIKRSHFFGSDEVRVQTSTWLVQHVIETRSRAEQIAREFDIQANEAKLVPWGGIAVYIDRGCGYKQSCDGKLFCFLPLSATIDQPAHMHGFFALPSSRREPLSGDGMIGVSRGLVQWNQYLLDEVIAKAYAQLICAAANTQGELAWEHWPRASKVLDNRDMLASVVRYLSSQDVCLRTVDGRWTSITDAVFVRSMTDAPEAAVATHLARFKVNIVDAPGDIVKALLKSFNLTILTPSLFRRQLAGSASALMACNDADEQLKLLKYALKDENLNEISAWLSQPPLNVSHLPNEATQDFLRAFWQNLHATASLQVLRGRFLLMDRHECTTYSLAVGSGLFVANDQDVHLTELLEKLGVVFLAPSIFPTQVRQMEAAGYVCRLTPTNVLSRLRLDPSKIGYLSGDEVTQLRSFLCHGGPALIANYRAIMRSLPIWPSAATLFSTHEELIAIQVRCIRNEAFMALKDMGPIIVTNPNIKFIRITPSECKAVEIPILDGNAYFSRYVIPYLNGTAPAAELELLNVFLSKPELYTNKSLCTQLAKAKFVPTNDHCGDHCRCLEDLFAPNDALRGIYEGEAVFPMGTYADKSVIDGLIRIGLKNQLTWDDVQERLSYLNNAKWSKAVHCKAIALANYLDMNLEQILITNESCCQMEKALRVARWFPQHTGEGLCSPQSARPLEDAYLVDLVVPVACEVGTALKRRLGWNKPASLQLVIEQLAKLLKNRPLDFLRIYQIYAYISSHLSEQGYEYEAVIEAFHEDALIVADEDIPVVVSAERVSRFPGPVQLKPDYYPLPKTLSGDRYQALFKCILKEKPGCAEMLAMLERLPSRKKNPTDADIRQVINIVKYLAQNYPDTAPQWLLPTTTNEFANVSEIHYNDAGRGFSRTGVTDKYKIAHHLVPEGLADTLDLQLLSKALLLAGITKWTPFEQGEPLTARIKNVLEDYGEQSICYEMIANADDCGTARKVIFIMDSRIHLPKTPLLSKHLGDWQREALWVYNDGNFTDEDFNSLLNLGVSSKKGNGSIGRYGLGFNSAYSLTDVPMIISNDTFCMLDPNKLYGPDENEGGVKLDELSKSKILKAFSSQFQVFEDLIPNFSVARPSQGTLFRFPLRSTRKLVAQSQIGAHITEMSSIKTMLQHLKSVAHSIFSFLQRIEVIQVVEVSGVYTRSCRVPDRATLWTAEVTNVTTALRQERCYLAQAALHFNSGTVELMKCKREIFELNVSIVEKGRQPWERSTIVCTGIAPDLITDANEDLQAFVRSSGLIPTGGVAVTFPDAKYSSERDQPGLYSFLPLPVTTQGLPPRTALNGMFALTSDRKTLWLRENQSLTIANEQRKVLWNELILCTLLPSLHAHLLEHIAKRIFLAGHKAIFLTEAFYELMGVITESPLPWITQYMIALTKALYLKKVLLSPGIPVRKLKNQLIAPSNGDLMECTLAEDEQKALCVLLGRHGNEGRAPVTLPSAVLDNFEKTCEVIKISPEHISTLVSERNVIVDAVARGSQTLAQTVARIIVPIINFMTTEPSCRHLLNLAIFPLVDGSVHSLADGVKYAVRRNMTHTRFDERHDPVSEGELDVHSIAALKLHAAGICKVMYPYSRPLLNTLDQLVARKTLPIEHPSSAVIGKLLRTNPQAIQRWERTYWDVIVAPGANPEDFRGVRIIPLHNGTLGPFLSVEVLEHPPKDRAMFLKIMEKLHFTDIIAYEHQRTIAQHPICYQFVRPFTAQNFLKGLTRSNPSLEEFQNLDCFERALIHGLIINSTDLSTYDTDIQCSLDKLPIWTVHGQEERVALSCIRLLPLGVPWIPGTGKWKYLRNVHDATWIERFTETGRQSVAAYLHDHVLPGLLPRLKTGTLTNNQWRELIRAVLASNISRVSDRACVANDLQIPTAFNDTHRAPPNRLYHPTTSLCASILPPNHFPAAWLSPYYSALLNLGMRHQVDAQAFIECADYIHSNSLNPGEDVIERARILLDYLCSNYSALRLSKDQWNSVMGLKIVPTQQVFTYPYTIDTHKASSLGTLATTRAPRFKLIVWTQAPVYHHTARIPSDGFWQQCMSVTGLSRQDAPKVQEVATHLRNIVENAGKFHKTKTGVENLSLIAHSIYDWLDKALANAPDGNAQQMIRKLLENTPSVFLGEDCTSWVNATQLYFGLAEDLSPNVRAVPESLVTYETLLKVLGAKDTYEDVKIHVPAWQHQGKLFGVECWRMLHADDGASRFGAADYQIKIGDTVIPAHKIVLGSNCSQFQTTFRSGWKEATENVHCIDDISPQLMRIWLRYIYLGDVVFSTDEKFVNKVPGQTQHVEDTTKKEDRSSLAIELMHLCDRYQLNDQRLLSSCERFLVSCCLVDNVMELYNNAQECRASQLEAFCVSYMKKRPEAIRAVQDKRSDDTKDVDICKLEAVLGQAD
ncbi:hypothetical protein HDU85_005654 [Gaertneriomyces sp. JEL0708]|nr:hypothetical protein HDU85_005654 [Gaertneriomyces sp. JEL0708]